MYNEDEMDSVVVKLLRDYISVRSDIKSYKMFIVWKAKVLQNWKYLLVTNIPDERYYEITYNGDRKEFYIDEYVKLNNTVIDWL